MLVLASKSETRKTMLANAGLDFVVRTVAIDERALEKQAVDSGADSAGVACMLARAKALAVSALCPGALVLGADQTLDCEGASLHKPSDRAAARAQLKALGGRSHDLHAGFALVRDGVVLACASDSATLVMHVLSDAELDTVLTLEGDAVLSSVGGYRLEGPSVRLFAGIEGDYFTILGLPLLRVIDALRQHAPELLRENADHGRN